MTNEVIPTNVSLKIAEIAATLACSVCNQTGSIHQIDINQRLRDFDTAVSHLLKKLNCVDRRF